MDEKLARAWGFIKNHIEEFESKHGNSTHEKARFRATVALAIGCSKVTLDSWLVDESALVKKTNGDDHFRGIVGTYKSLSKHSSVEWRLASSVAEILELESEDFRRLDRYEGTYKIIRVGNDGLVIGEVLFSNDNGAKPWFHYHSSKQQFGDGETTYEEVFEHSGPVFPVEGRIYCLAIGSNASDIYIRKMIFRGSDRPHNNIMYGVLLTETHPNLTPFASPFALISLENPRKDQDQYISQAVTALKNMGPNIKFPQQSETS